ncbi:MAG: ribonuclease P protein component [Mycoplasmatales bacterium]|nr:ribonuclease P protein component [Mycoplasmatales bacterium]
MKKENRLRKNHDFQKIINSKNSVVSKYLVIYYRENNLSKLRVGISVSKKFINAVGRNKLRRQVRSIMDELSIYNMGFDIVLILRKPFINNDFLFQKQSIKKLMQRIT